MLSQAAAAAALLLPIANAVSLTTSDTSSIKEAAATVAYGLVKYYTGNNTGDTPGNLPDPYYWWEAGAMFGTLVDYYYLTGDESYVNITTQALLHQAGDDADFMPSNQTSTEGNDDQGFWAMAAMSAAENNYPNPDSDDPQWLALAQAVFNEYASRWDTETCSGGLRWQIFSFNNGYNYKNAIANGCFFNLAARLARFTGNETYSDWAENIWEWMATLEFFSDEWAVFDGSSTKDSANCSSKDHTEWSYNAGIFLHGAAIMYNATDGNSTWGSRIDGLWSHIETYFFNNSIMIEPACESNDGCNTDQLSFKGYLSRWMAGTVEVAPYMSSKILPLMINDAAAAALACTGSPASGFSGHAGTACGFRWTTGAFDGSVGVGQQMNALSAIMYTIVQEGGFAPVTSSTGGTSEGNPNAGSTTSSSTLTTLSAITTGDRVAAGFITTFIAVIVLGGSAFMVK